MISFQVHKKFNVSMNDDEVHRLKYKNTVGVKLRFLFCLFKKKDVSNSYFLILIKFTKQHSPCIVVDNDTIPHVYTVYICYDTQSM